MITYVGCAGKIFLLPIRRVEFNFQNSTDKDFYIEEIEAESSYNIASIDRSDDSGANRILGYKIDSTIYVPHNFYKSNDLIQNLMAFANKPHVLSGGHADHFHLKIMTGGAPINSNGSQILELCNFNGNVGIAWKIESVQYRPRLIITINANFKTYERILWG